MGVTIEHSASDHDNFADQTEHFLGSDLHMHIFRKAGSANLILSGQSVPGNDGRRLHSPELHDWSFTIRFSLVP